MKFYNLDNLVIYNTVRYYTGKARKTSAGKSPKNNPRVTGFQNIMVSHRLPREDFLWDYQRFSIRFTIEDYHGTPISGSHTRGTVVIYIFAINCVRGATIK